MKATNSRKIEIREALVFTRKTTTDKFGDRNTDYDVTLDGRHVATVTKGWTRNGGAGWVCIFPNDYSSLTKKNLADCRECVAHRVAKNEAAAATEIVVPPRAQWTALDHLGWAISKLDQIDIEKLSAPARESLSGARRHIESAQQKLA